MKWPPVYIETAFFTYVWENSWCERFAHGLSPLRAWGVFQSVAVRCCIEAPSTHRLTLLPGAGSVFGSPGCLLCSSRAAHRSVCYQVGTWPHCSWGETWISPFTLSNMEVIINYMIWFTDSLIFFAGVSLPEFGSSHILHGGAGR